MRREIFEETIAKEPNNPLHREIYADWLEEQGDPSCQQLRKEAQELRKRYIVMTATEPAGKYGGKYGKVAVVKLAEGFFGKPPRIDIRLKSIAEITRMWRKLYVGKTDRSEFYRTLAFAKEVCSELNAENSVPK